MRLPRVLGAFSALLACSSALAATPLQLGNGETFINWEHPHVTPLGITPSGSRLLAVNTPDNRLEIFDTSGLQPVALEPIPVGLDPVSVRVRNEYEAWVVNHVSDTISVIDLLEGRVVHTLFTRDEPTDVVFAGSPERAFVTCSQENYLQVFDLADLGAAPVEVPIVGEEPRALTVSGDGSEVYLAVYESGNATTILGGDKLGETLVPPNAVNLEASPYGGQNPPPNAGTGFSPPIDPSLPEPPKVSHIVRKDDQGRWMDDNNGDWTPVVSGGSAAESGRIPGWDLADHDLAIIDADTLEIEYVRRLMNINMALAVNPASGDVAIVGTDATNEIRFEPNLVGTFVHVLVAIVDPESGASSVVDLNDHLTYQVPTLPQSERDKSIGDPRGIVWDAAGEKAYVTGMGSNNLVVIDPTGARAGQSPTIEVGEGPTGIVLSPDGSRLFVLNKFESSISVVDVATEVETARTAFPDPSPLAIKAGRKHLYDTHGTSGLGQVSCASCHVDARMDRLAWDLGNPGGVMIGLEGQNLMGQIPLISYSTFEPFHPMKGPLLTQTLQDIIGHEPFHWRGDKFGLEDFGGVFMGLQGDDEPLVGAEMQEFEDFLATIHFAPNPFRNIDNSLKTDIELEGHFASGKWETPAGDQLPNGNPQNGLALFLPPNLLGNNGKACSTCHTMPAGYGTNMEWDGEKFNPIAPGPFGEEHMALTAPVFQAMHTARIAPLRNLYERTGFKYQKPLSTAGFGIRHDGSLDGPEATLSNGIFFQITSDQMIADLIAFIKSMTGSELPLSDGTDPVFPPGALSQDTHAGVGQQVTFENLADLDPVELARYAVLLGEGELDRLGLVAQVQVAGEARSAIMVGPGQWQSDRATETWTQVELEGFAAPGAPLVMTAVVEGHEVRIGIDRDEDGFLDLDEADAGSDSADAASTPDACAVAVPQAPVALGAIGVGENLIRLDWTDVSGEELEYRVERSIAGLGAYQLVAVLDADAESFVDVGVLCGKDYDYRVSARNCAGTSVAAEVFGVDDGCLGLTGDLASISIAAGGTQTLELRTGPTLANALYWVLGSDAGTSPAIPLGFGVELPLIPDDYFFFTLESPNGGPLVNTQGLLDDAGMAQAAIQISPNLLPDLAGNSVHHAFVVLQGEGVVHASNAVELSFTP